jgi:hypothetical protein
MIHGMHLLSGYLGRPALYLDPGSGSFILQVLLAALLGGGFAIKAYWKKIKRLFSKNPPDESAVDESDDEDSGEEN